MWKQRKSVSDMLMEFALCMCSNFHGSPDNWLDKPLVELSRWALIASELIEKEIAKHNRQRLGPGL